MTPQQTARSVIPVVLLVVGLGMYVSSNAPAPGSLGATVVAATPSQQDPRVAAIQTVIQTANKEQAQALESGDPSVMSNTATPPSSLHPTQTNNRLPPHPPPRIDPLP